MILIRFYRIEKGVIYCSSILYRMAFLLLKEMVDLRKHFHLFLLFQYRKIGILLLTYLSDPAVVELLVGFQVLNSGIFVLFIVII